MPRQQHPFTRPSNLRPPERLFLIATEGSVTEKRYFEAVQQSFWKEGNGVIHLVILPTPKKNGSSHPDAVFKRLKEVKKEIRLNPHDAYWVVMDWDQWVEEHKLDMDEFVLRLKKNPRFFLAVSRPCFEFWLLLHLTDPIQFSDSERRQLLENPKISAKKRYLDQLLGDLQDGNRGYNKRPNPQYYLVGLEDAMKRAKALDQGSFDYPKQLGSHVYKLMEQLLEIA